LKTSILLEEGKVGLKAQLKKRKYLAEKLQTLNQQEAKDILLASGHDVDKCIENISVVISNSGDDDCPFENIWWFSLAVKQETKVTKTRTRRTRKVKNEQSE
tara:strand:- start:775 stop:1080 length:306 start_codon:yes stop_codon:yes gene_type:complete